MDNAADLRSLKRKAREARLAEAQRRDITVQLMSSPAGRVWVLDILEHCNIFATSFSVNALQTAFREGQRDVGLRLLADIVSFSPDQYIQMMRESADRKVAEDGRRNHPDPDRANGSDQGLDGDDHGARIDSEYDPSDRDAGYEDIGA